ncbi:Hpt domain-containing protein [Bdellovibrio sp. HCB185ZH]|uniref:Hpt domain-containing protein n=1 Tax=Bdellovibrio sp. HCB185ZH TaxID=3394235 RepID=UPI0039A5E4B4
MNSQVCDKNVWQELREFEKNEGAEGFFKQLLQAVLTTAQPVMDSLVKSSVEGDVKKTHYYAHNLKSTCASLGAKSLAQKLGVIETGCKEVEPVIHHHVIAEAKAEFTLFLNEVQEEFNRIN